MCCSVSSSNCCFLTCIQISQEAGQMVWYSHLFKNFPHFVVIYLGKGFGIVSKTEVDVFLELSCFFDDPADVGSLSLVRLPFLNAAWTSGISRFTYCWSLVWRILSITLLACESESEVTQLCPTLCDPMDCSPSASSVHGILQPRILEWVVTPSSRRSSPSRDRTCISYVSCVVGRFLPLLPRGKSEAKPRQI